MALLLCYPCSGFTPKLAQYYRDLKAAGKNLEVVFVSSDRDEHSFNEYYGEHPWLALPFGDRDRKGKLSQKYKVQGIPTLVFLGEDGKVITANGREKVMTDPEVGGRGGRTLGR
jgi:nucleoredoxin